jgi:hypothetical protein
MAPPKFSFTVITPQIFENRRKASAVAATTVALPGKPPRNFSAPVGVVSKLKEKNESLAISSHDSTLHKAVLECTGDNSCFCHGMCASKNYSILRAFVFCYVIVFAGIPFWHVVLELGIFATLPAHPTLTLHHLRAT